MLQQPCGGVAPQPLTLMTLQWTSQACCSPSSDRREEPWPVGANMRGRGKGSAWLLPCSWQGSKRKHWPHSSRIGLLGVLNSALRNPLCCWPGAVQCLAITKGPMCSKMMTTSEKSMLLLLLRDGWKQPCFMGKGAHRSFRIALMR